PPLPPVIAAELQPAASDEANTPVITTSAKMLGIVRMVRFRRKCASTEVLDDTRPVSFRRAVSSPDHEPNTRPRHLRQTVLPPFSRDVRAAARRALPLLPPPDAQPVGRRRSGAGQPGAGVRHARADDRAAAAPAGVAVPPRL